MIFGFLCYYNYNLYDSPDYYHSLPLKVKYYDTTTKYYQPELRNYTDYTFKSRKSYKCFVDQKEFKPMPLSEINYNIREEFKRKCENYTSKKFNNVQICYFNNITFETRKNTTINASLLDNNLMPRTTQTGIAYPHVNGTKVYFDCDLNSKSLKYVGINPITVIYSHPLACRAGAKRKMNVVRCTSTRAINASLKNSTNSANISMTQQINSTNTTTAVNMSNTNISLTNSTNTLINSTNHLINETNATISIVADESLISNITSTQQPNLSNNITIQGQNETNGTLTTSVNATEVKLGNETNSTAIPLKIENNSTLSVESNETNATIPQELNVSDVYVQQEVNKTEVSTNSTISQEFNETNSTSINETNSTNSTDQ